MMNIDEDWDVVVIGGSYAGLSAAMALGRSLRKVLVIDSGTPCNIQTPHSHNFLTQDGSTPAQISQIARDQVLGYRTVEFINDLVIKANQTGQGFEIHLESGKRFYSKKLIFATGIKDQLLNIPGFAECWGVSVVHCPYCHGYEYKGKRTAILANGEPAIHYAMLVGNLTKDLTILTNVKAEFTSDQFAKLQKHNIKIREAELIGIEHENGYLKQVVLLDAKLEFDALYFRPPFQQQSGLPASLGCEMNEQGYLKVDTTQKTTVEGIYACGDNSSMMRSVANAVATGNLAGGMVNRELAAESF